MRTVICLTPVVEDMRRRGLLAGLATTATVGLAGCSVLDDDEVTERSAAPARVADDALAQTSFESKERRERTTERTLEVADQRRTVSLRNWQQIYTASVPTLDFDASRVSLFTTPTVSIAGRDANPFHILDEDQLVAEMGERVDTDPIEDVEKTGERPVTVLDEQLTVSEFDARTTVETQEFVLRLHLAQRTHEGDLLVLFALHPKLLDQTDDIDTLCSGIEHPVETVEED